ncbi:MAG: phosphoribosylaminoimidazolesuccinocarboxamide synthase [Calditrichia bacterium]|nr:phosphoribosylaminoimidazolesuccinocarboxamide synthase [Calditrichia bacterium]
MTEVIIKTDIPAVKLLNRGKVRDIYDAGKHLLFVTTDRISAFDVVMDSGIPHKGLVLSQISKYWFDVTKNIVENHFITDNVAEYPEPFNRYETLLKGRSMLVRKTDPVQVECIVRGYLSGSAWKEYRNTTNLFGYQLPDDLQNSSKLPVPLFTPSTKATSGHDINITFEEMQKTVGDELSRKLKVISLAIYQAGFQEAQTKGIIIADTKFEFGTLDDQIILIDEVLTPDSSRFWPAADYETGRNQASLDKQYLRDYLETLDWDKTPPPPALPDEIVNNTSKKYQEILRILTGKTIEEILD